MKIYAIHNSNYSTSNTQNTLPNKQTVTFGHVFSGRGGGPDNDGFEPLLAYLAVLTSPIWGPFYLGNELYKKQRANAQKKLEIKATAMAQELYRKDKAKVKSPEELLADFIKASVIADPEKGLNKVVGHADLKLDIHHDILSPLVAVMNGDKDLVKTNSLPNAVVFFGPNGCGKTYFIEAIGEQAKELGLNFTEPVIDAYDSESSVKNIRKAFFEAEDNFKKTGKYTFIYIDELDSFATDRKLSLKHIDEVNTLLKLTENCSKRGIIWLGATNNIKYIDRALMDRVSKIVPMPPMQDYEIFDTLVYRLVKEKGITSAKDLDYNKISQKLNSTPNKYSPRNIEDIAKLALGTYKASASHITTNDLLNIMDKKVTPKVNQRMIDELNEDISYAKNEGYVKNSYSDFKFEKGE